jgi:hypothetical protein
MPSTSAAPAPSTPAVNPRAKQIKAELQIAAATLTAAVIGKTNVQVAADPTIKDANLQSLNVTAAQLHKIFYAFLDAAENNTGTDADGTINGWADPIMPVGVGEGASAPGGAANLAGIPVAAILQFLAAQPPTAFAGLPAAAVAALNNLANQIAPASPPAVPAPSGPAQVIAGS